MASIYKDKRSLIVQNAFVNFRTGELLSPIETAGYTVVQVAESYFIGGFEINEHRQHCDLEITLPITGTLTSSADGREERVEKNGVYFSFGGERHRLSAQSSCRFLTLALNAKESTEALFSEIRARFFGRRTLHGTEAAQILARIGAEFSGERRAYFETYLDALIGELLVLVLRHESDPPPAAKVRSEHCLPEIVSYMDCNFLSICSPEELSRFGYSYHYICKIFSETYGLSLRAYLCAKRMDYAANRLKEGQSVSEVSVLLGYSSPYNFSRAFKKHFGYPPKYAPLRVDDMPSRGDG